MFQILLIEDDPIISQQLRSDLQREGFGVTIAGTLAEGMRKLAESDWDLLLLDINLPDGVSYRLFESIHQERPSLPGIFLTAQTDEQSAVRALSLGAVDFVRKPFGRAELLWRIRNHLTKRSGHVTYRGLSVSAEKRTASFEDRVVYLAPREIDILLLLAKHGSSLVSRETILQSIDEEAALYDKSINSYVSRLRSKLERLAPGQFKITSVYGAGYRLE